MAAPRRWTDALDAELRRLWAQNLSNNEIAAKLGKGRNSVIARANDLGLGPKAKRVPARTPRSADGVSVPRPDAVGAIPERTLAAEVIASAIRDLSKIVPPDGRWSRDPTRYICAEDRRKSVLFLTAASGEWAQSRELWADLAGIDPDGLRAYVLREMQP